MLLLLVASARAGVEFHEAEMYLWPGGAEIELAAPAAEVHLLLAFRFGLYAITEEGEMAPAVAAVLVEYNDAERSTCYWNPYRPLPFDGEANPEWAGSDDEPGVFFTEDATTEIVARTVVCRFIAAERLVATHRRPSDSFSREAAMNVMFAGRSASRRMR